MSKKMMMGVVATIAFIILVGSATALGLYLNRSKFTVEILLTP